MFLSIFVFARIVPLRDGGFFAHWFSTALMQLLLLHIEVVSPNRLHAIGQLFSSKGDIFYGNPMTTDLEKQRGQVRPFSLNSLQSIFYFLFFGLCFSFACVLFEVIFAKNANRNI